MTDGSPGDEGLGVADSALLLRGIKAADTRAIDVC